MLCSGATKRCAWRARKLRNQWWDRTWLALASPQRRTYTPRACMPVSRTPHRSIRDNVFNGAAVEPDPRARQLLDALQHLLLLRLAQQPRPAPVLQRRGCVHLGSLSQRAQIMRCEPSGGWWLWTWSTCAPPWRWSWPWRTQPPRQPPIAGFSRSPCRATGVLWTARSSHRHRQRTDRHHHVHVCVLKHRTDAVWRRRLVWNPRPAPPCTCLNKYSTLSTAINQIHSQG